MKLILLAFALLWLSVAQIKAQEKGTDLRLDSLTIREVPPDNPMVRLATDSIILEVFLDNKHIASMPEKMRPFLNESKANRKEQDMEQVDGKIVQRIRLFFVTKDPGH